MDRRGFLTIATLAAATVALTADRGRKQPRADRQTSPSKQAAVALTPADGETIAGSSQSNFAGNGFFTRNDLTYARDWTGPNPLGGTFNGFDDPTFIPISIWVMDFTGTSMYPKLDDLAINGMLPAHSTIHPVNNVTYGKWMVVTDSAYPAGTVPSSGDAAVIGVSTGEEPGSDFAFNTTKNAAATWLADPNNGPGRIHLFNFSDNVLTDTLWYDPSVGVTREQAVSASDPNPPTQRRQWTTCDMYWYAGVGSANSSAFKLPFRLYTHLYPTEATADQALRGCHYGSMLDAIRAAYTQPSGPIGIWVENGAPFAEAESHEITPAEMGWAIWSTFVHGARSIHYFNHTFRTDDPAHGVNNFDNPYYGGPGVAGTGIYAAAKQINRRALQIGPVINAPRDGYFVWGTTSAISQAGFLTAVTSTNARAPYAGVEACCKWNPLDSKHYILSTTRESGTATNIPATYRMVDQGQTSAVPVFGGAPIPIQRGGEIPAGFCEFSDTYALASDYKAYRID